jgi:hypothetical protein
MLCDNLQFPANSALLGDKTKCLSFGATSSVGKTQQNVKTSAARKQKSITMKPYLLLQSADLRYV